MPSLEDFAATCASARDSEDGSPFASQVKLTDSIADRAVLSRESHDFHRRAGTLTDAVAENLRRYADGASCLRVAHQPNFLPSINVVAQAGVCNALNHRLGGGHAEVFFLLDYDTNDDRRYRQASLPSLLSRRGVWSITAPPLGTCAVSMFRETPPSPEFVAACVSAVHNWARQQLAILPRWHRHRLLRHRVLDAVELVGSMLYDAGGNAVSMADFNSIVMSWIVNRVLGLPTLFLPGSRALRSLAGPIAMTWHSRDVIAQASAAARRPQASVGGGGGGVDASAGPLWKQCGCGTRLALTGDVFSDEMRFRCHRCGTAGVVNDRNVTDFAAAGELLPRVIADDLLDGVAWGNVAGCDYRGGLQHYAKSAQVAHALGLRALPVYLSARFPKAAIEHLAGREFCAALDDPDAGETMDAARNLIASGRVSAVMALVWAGRVDAGQLARDMEPVGQRPRTSLSSR